MKITVTQQFELSPDQAIEIFNDQLRRLAVGAYFRGGAVFQDDPEWRHGSVQEVEIKAASNTLKCAIRLRDALGLRP